MTDFPLSDEPGERPIEEEYAFRDALAALPLMGDAVLAMQARNIVLVDLYLREWEQDALHAHIEAERTVIPDLMVLSAFSQQWVFALYELLRTWRQRCSELISFRKRLESLPPDQHSQFLSDALREVSSPTGAESLMTTALRDRLRAAATEGVTELERALDGTEAAWRRLEGLRVLLAKNEVPKSRGRPNLTPSVIPGYARQDMITGSLSWPVEYVDGTMDIVSRSQLREAIIDAANLLRQLAAE